MSNLHRFAPRPPAGSDTFGWRLYSAMITRVWTQADLAHRAQLPKERIRELINDRARPSAPELETLALALGIDDEALRPGAELVPGSSHCPRAGGPVRLGRSGEWSVQARSGTHGRARRLYRRLQKRKPSSRGLLRWSKRTSKPLGCQNQLEAARFLMGPSRAPHPRRSMIQCSTRRVFLNPIESIERERPARRS